MRTKGEGKIVPDSTSLPSNAGDNVLSCSGPGQFVRASADVHGYTISTLDVVGVPETTSSALVILVTCSSIITSVYYVSLTVLLVVTIVSRVASSVGAARAATTLKEAARRDVN